MQASIYRERAFTFIHKSVILSREQAFNILFNIFYISRLH